MLRSMVLMMSLAACGSSGSKPACNVLADLEVKCTPQLSDSARDRARSSELAMCRMAFDAKDEKAPGDLGEVARTTNAGIRHNAKCAETSGTCDEFARCKEQYFTRENFGARDDAARQ